MKHSATYSPEDNKLRLYPAHRLDKDEYARIKAAGFSWAPKQELFVAPAWSPEREDALLEFVEEIEDEDKSLVERAEERAERFEDYSERRLDDAKSAQAAVDRIASGIPFGQPILVGHHSERHARKDAERIENGMRKSVKMWETSKYWEQRAVGAIRAAKYKELPAVRARRIKKIEADLRGVEREIKEMEAGLKMWTSSPLSLDEARKVANLFPFTVVRTDGLGWNAWDVLRPEAERFRSCPGMTPEQVQEKAAEKYPRGIARNRRWIDHYNNRLAYERAMLNESGYIEPPKVTRAVLPLLNYSGLVSYRNLYNRHEITSSQTHPLTKAEYASINKDYKGTRISADGTHRVRTALVGRGAERGLHIIFLTDQKEQRPEQAKKRIEEGTKAISAARMARATVMAHNRSLSTEMTTTPKTTTPDEDALKVEAMKEALREGIKVVSAPQLFPTPHGLAARMIEEARIEPGNRVLEPSAGTGRLLDPLFNADGTGSLFDPDNSRPVGLLHAVEINPDLAKNLRTTYVCAEVHAADFLSLNGSLGTFDRIVMNPPFANAADVMHIKHAWGYLAPGGRLVALCANGPRQREALMPTIEENGGTWEDLPEGSFSESGTNVRVALIILDK